ncbi:MAG TPA: hypothetical protein VFI70_08595 [Nitrososphaeraceae archaeon]|nr:hypothetical protein [Nitrososphaeraceae archaeon]
MEAFLPLIEKEEGGNDDNNNNNTIDIESIEKFCRTYPILTTDISFKFRLGDEVNNASTTAVTTIEYPAVHPISTKWINTCSVFSLLADEFVSSFTSVYDKKSTKVYDVLRRFREGFILKKTDENQISIEELLSSEDYTKKLEQYYYDLTNILDPSKELSLPYGNNKERKESLVSRVCENLLDPKYRFLLDSEKAVYKSVRGRYNDDFEDYYYLCNTHSP